MYGLDSESDSEVVDNESKVCEDYIRLVSRDGFEYTVERRVTSCSSTISAMLSGPVRWSELSSAPLATLQLDAPGFILEKVVQFFYHVDAGLPAGEFPVDIEYVFPLMNLAHYLGV
jgi:hypothetical protein